MTLNLKTGELSRPTAFQKKHTIGSKFNFPKVRPSVNNKMISPIDGWLYYTINEEGVIDNIYMAAFYYESTTTSTKILRTFISLITGNRISNFNDSNTKFPKFNFFQLYEFI